MPEDKSDDQQAGATALRLVYLLQLLFFLTAVSGLDAPFLSAHNERQNQTYDMARHVFQNGWKAVLTPTASFSLRGYADQAFTVARLEVPFHGLLGWPLIQCTTHDRAVVRLISVVFSLISIRLLFGLLRHWAPPHFALAGTIIWSASPLVLHFGQVPMPDILCTCGMLASILFALRGRCAASSWSFLFAILAKETVIFFGLPILVALLLAKNCRSVRQAALLSFAWGALPLAGLMGWVGLGLFDPPTPWSLFRIVSEKKAEPIPIRFFCSQGLTCLFPCGVGVIGFLALAATPWRVRLGVNPWLKRAILVSCSLYTVGMYRTISEPQYYLPLLVWVTVATCAGLPWLWEKWQGNLAWKTALATAVVGHCLLAWLVTHQLKASRIPAYASIEATARLIPPGARVVVFYRHFGGGPAVWLDRNVYAVADVPTLEQELPLLRSLRFTHLAILDVTSKQGNASKPVPLATQIKTALHLGAASQTQTTTGYAEPSSAERQFCDKNFQRLFATNHAVLYAIAAPPS